MIFYGIVFVLSWLLFLVAGSQEYWKWGIVAGAIGLSHELLGIGTGLWSYDHNVFAVLSNSLGLYPVTGMLLLKYLPERQGGITALYLAAWVAASFVFEMVYVFTGLLLYLKWLVPYSLLLYAVTYTLYVVAYRQVMKKRTTLV